MDGIDGTADKAVGIGARAATAGDEPFVNPQAVADEPRDALMRIAARFGAFVAAGAGFEVEDQQSL